jgi:hypothetical protein
MTALLLSWLLLAALLTALLLTGLLSALSALLLTGLLLTLLAAARLIGILGHSLLRGFSPRVKVCKPTLFRWG